MADDNKPGGPDLTKGVASADFVDGKLLGHVGDDPVLLVQLGAEVVAIDALCSHYHGPLAEGLVVDETVRCPWHHACFSLRNGEAQRAPALDPIPCWRVERLGDKIFVREKLPPAAPKVPDSFLRLYSHLKPYALTVGEAWSRGPKLGRDCGRGRRGFGCG